MAVRSSLLPAALTLVSGVFFPFVLPPALVVPVPVVSDAPLALDACFAAFSARRFCFADDGGIVVGGEEKKERPGRAGQRPAPLRLRLAHAMTVACCSPCRSSTLSSSSVTSHA